METQKIRSEKVKWLNSIDIPNNIFFAYHGTSSYVVMYFFFCFSMHVLSKWRRGDSGRYFLWGRHFLPSNS
jgi:hypothetical protein